MATKIRNVELLTLARSDAGTPVLGHVGVGIDANLIQDFEMGLSRVSSAAQFNLALNVEGATTNTAHYGGIAFTQGASADTVMASIKAVNTSVDGYVDLSFNTSGQSDALYIMADGKVGINTNSVNAGIQLQVNGGDIYTSHTVKAKGLYSDYISSTQSLTVQSGGDAAVLINPTSGGNVGIGTGSATLTEALEVIGSIKLSDDLEMASGKMIDWGNGDARIIEGETQNYSLTFKTWDGVGCDPRMKILGDGKVGIGTGSSAPTTRLHVENVAVNATSLTTTTVHNIGLRLGFTSGTNTAGHIYGGINLGGTGEEYAGMYAVDGGSGAATDLALFVGATAGIVEAVRIKADGKVGIGKAPSELLDLNGNAKATKFIGALEGNADTATALETARAIHGVSFDGTGNIDLTEVVQDTVGAMFTSNTETGITVAYQDSDGTIDLTVGTLNQDTTGNAATATTLETARNIVVGKSVAGAGDIDAITQSFNGGANISFDSTLNSHLPADLRGTTSDNIADEPSNNAVKIIGSDINTPRLKINRQGLIVGFEEVATSGGSGSGGISALTLTTNGLLYLNAGLTTQTETTSTSTPTLNLYLKATGLFTALTESTGTMSMTIGGTTKTLALPNASFTQLDLSGTNLQVTVGGTQRTRDLSGLSVASATNATNTTNINVAADGSNATRYLNFVDGTSGNRALKVDANLTYNPSSNTLATTNFVGALSGNATTSSGLLIGSTTYVPSSAADGGESLVLRNSSNEVSIAKLILSDNTTVSNLDVIVGKISGSDTLHEFSSSQVRTFLGDSRFLPAPSSGVYNITVSNATSATSATNATTATRLNTTTNGVVKVINSNGTLSIGALASGDIPNNASDTSGNAATATQAGGLTWSGSSRIADLAANANTIVVRGTAGAVNVGSLGCTSISASASITSSTTMQAQKIVLTNSADSLRAKDIRPYGTVTDISTGFWPTYYGVSGSKIGDHTNSSIGAFDSMSFKIGYNQQGTVVSDERIKENISNFNVGLDFIRLLQPRKYTYKASSSPRNHYGVIAQEIETVINTLSLENPSFINIPDYHDKTDEERESNVKAYDRDQIMWILFNAVKQLDTEVQDLKKQLEEK